MSDREFRVLVLADSRSFHTDRLIRELNRQGCSALLLSAEDGSTPHETLPRRGPLSTLTYALNTSTVMRLVQKFRPNIINAHYASGYGFLASRLKRRELPVLLHVWGSDVLVVPEKSFVHRWKVRHALRAADQVVADSQYLARSAAALVPGIPTEVIPWGVERRYFGLHRSDYTPGRPLRIIVPRQHEPIYDNMFIVRALRDVIEAGRIEIMFPSFGSRYAAFRREADAVTAGRVHYYDKLPRAKFLALMAGFDVYLSAARSDSSPVSLLEAMALGLLPVAADIPGVREWLTSETGFLFPPREEAALRETINRIIESGDAHGAMRRANRARVECEAVFEDNVSRQIQLMKGLAASREIEA